VNRIVLVGRLENTPEIRYTSSGIPVSNFSLSVRRSHPNSDGVWEKDVFRIVTWRKLAETCCKYLERGRWIAVDGKLQNRFINSSNNERRVMVEIHADDIRFLDFRPQQKEREISRQDDEQRVPEKIPVNLIDEDIPRVDDIPMSESYSNGDDRPIIDDIDEDSEKYRPYLQDEEGTPLDMTDI
jgi:single-strand DNA-binding protein